MPDGQMHMKDLLKSSTGKTKRLLPVLVIILIAVVIGGICIGSVKIPPVSVFRILFGGLKGTPEYSIVMLTRIPRTLGCLLAGMCLAVSGYVIQAVLSNPLAAPNVIGVNTGAGIGVCLLCAIYPSAIALRPFIAFLGALVAVLLVLFVSERCGSSRMSLILTGIAVSSVLSATIDAVVTLIPEALNGYTDFRIGGFSNLKLSQLIPAAIIALAAFCILFLLANEVDIISLGADTATGLGINVRLIRIILLCIAAALAGAAVSFAGLLGFVGLIVPHIVRRLSKEGSGKRILYCAIGGAAFVTICDIVARILFAPYEISVGIILSWIGGPFFIGILVKSRRHSYD